MAKTCSAVTAAVVFLFAIATADAARLLRAAAADTLTGAGISKAYYSTALTTNAEAVTNPRITGLAHNAATISAVASTRYETATKTASKEIEKSVSKSVTKEVDGLPAELPVAAFGTVAVAQTMGGASAMSGSEAMPLAVTEGTPGAARGTTLGVFNPSSLYKGTGKSKKVMTSSIGITYEAADAFTQSGMGDGPHALARAGEAVASSYSSNDHPLAVQDLMSIFKKKSGHY